MAIVGLFSLSDQPSVADRATQAANTAASARLECELREAQMRRQLHREALWCAVARCLGVNLAQDQLTNAREEPVSLGDGLLVGFSPYVSTHDLYAWAECEACHQLTPLFILPTTNGLITIGDWLLGGRKSRACADCLRAARNRQEEKFQDD